LRKAKNYGIYPKNSETCVFVCMFLSAKAGIIFG